MIENRKKHPLISAALSFIFPGAGQLYNEQFIKALILFAAAIASIVSIVHSAISFGNIIINEDTLPPAIPIIRIIASSLIYFGLWLYGIIDGAVSAQHISNTTIQNNETENVNPKPKTKEGLISLGVVLVIIGLFSLLHQLGIKFELLIKFGWPVALIMLGGYLLARTTGIMKGDK
jgi:hypothetical protein